MGLSNWVFAPTFSLLLIAAESCAHAAPTFILPDSVSIVEVLGNPSLTVKDLGNGRYKINIIIRADYSAAREFAASRGDVDVIEIPVKLNNAEMLIQSNSLFSSYQHVSKLPFGDQMRLEFELSSWASKSQIVELLNQSLVYGMEAASIDCSNSPDLPFCEKKIPSLPIINKLYAQTMKPELAADLKNFSQLNHYKNLEYLRAGGEEPHQDQLDAAVKARLFSRGECRASLAVEDAAICSIIKIYAGDGSLITALRTAAGRAFPGFEGSQDFNQLIITVDNIDTATRHKWHIFNKTTKDGLGSNRVGAVYATGSTVYAATKCTSDACTDGGLSISYDGGNTWITKSTQDGLIDNFVTGVSGVGSYIYAATRNGLSISHDSGRTWVTKTTVDGLGDNKISAVYAVGTLVYAATAGGLSISNDSGSTWINKTDKDGLGDNYYVIGVFAEGSHVYAATGGGLSISTNGGNAWVNKTFPDYLSSNIVTGVYADGATIYAATHGGLFISNDGGTSWTTKTIKDGLGSDHLKGVYVSGSTIYAVTSAFGNGAGGLSFSNDGGTSWTTKTIKDGLGSNSLWGLYAVGATVYVATSNAGVTIFAPFY